MDGVWGVLRRAKCREKRFRREESNFPISPRKRRIRVSLVPSVLKRPEGGRLYTLITPLCDHARSSLSRRILNNLSLAS